MKNKANYYLVSLLFAITCLYVVFNLGKWKDPRYWEFDVGGYYSYLPAIFIYHDLQTMNGYEKMEKRYFYTVEKYGYHQSQETGKWVNKYPIGVALMELPFYLIAHFLSLNIPSAAYDGYSPIFLLFMMIATIFYTCCGLWFLSKFLSKYFSSKAMILTLLMIAFGTNLFIYNANLPGSSHPFLFFLISALLFYCDCWYKSPRLKHSLLIGLFLGMCLITRPTAVLIVILPLFFLVNKLTGNKLKQPLLHLLLSIFGFFLVASIQMLYWKETSGHWIYYSYAEEGFNFLHPHIIDGLFSYRKGWFVYTPIAFLGIIGLWQISKSSALKHYFHPIVIYFALVVYVIFSWSAWYYGGGFGARAMIDSYGILALPLCALIESVFNLSEKWIKKTFVTILTSFICLNLFQTFQFQRGIMPWDGVNMKYYWSIFGDISQSEEKLKLLKTES